jgi:CcmD family protein
MSIDSRRGRPRRHRRFRFLCAIGTLLVMTWMSVASWVAAQPVAEGQAPMAELSGERSDGNGEAAGERAQAFVAVEGSVQEEVAGGPLLLGAYALVWLFLLAYVIVLARRTARTEQEVARLADLLRQHPG